MIFPAESWHRLQYESLSLYEKKLSSDFDHFEEWLDTPLDKLPRDRVQKLVDAFGGYQESQLEQAVRREHCNWDMPLRQGHAFKILLPEVQEFRDVAKIVALRHRLQIAEGKFEDGAGVAEDRLRHRAPDRRTTIFG